MPPLEQSSKMMSSEKGDKLNMHAFAIKEERKEAAPTSTPTPPSGAPGRGDVESFLVGAGNQYSCLLNSGHHGILEKEQGPLSFLPVNNRPEGSGTLSPWVFPQETLAD